MGQPPQPYVSFSTTCFFLNLFSSQFLVQISKFFFLQNCRSKILKINWFLTSVQCAQGTGRENNNGIVLPFLGYLILPQNISCQTCPETEIDEPSPSPHLSTSVLIRKSSIVDIFHFSGKNFSPADCERMNGRG